MVLLHNVAFFCYDFFQADEKDETHFHTIVNCITQSLKTQIIGRSYVSLTLYVLSQLQKLCFIVFYGSVFS
jgi:hypothetical protein